MVKKTRKPRNKRLPLIGYDGYSIDSRNHRVYNKHDNLLKPVLNAKGVTCIQLINNEGKRRMVPLHKLTTELLRKEPIEEASFNFEKEVVWVYYQNVNDSNRDNSVEYWSSLIRKMIPDMNYDEIKEILWYLRGS